MDDLNFYDEIRKLPLRAVAALMCVEVDVPEPVMMGTCWEGAPVEQPTEAPAN